jgi:hypothetical protein
MAARLVHIRDILKELLASDEIANDSCVYQRPKDAEELTVNMTYTRRGGSGACYLAWFYFILVLYIWMNIFWFVWIIGCGRIYDIFTFFVGFNLLTFLFQLQFYVILIKICMLAWLSGA